MVRTRVFNNVRYRFQKRILRTVAIVTSDELVKSYVMRNYASVTEAVLLSSLKAIN
jgi:hypothetical protein